MIAAVFHVVAFAALTFGLMLSAVLFVALAVILIGPLPRKHRPAGRHRAGTVLARAPRFDLAIDG